MVTRQLRARGGAACGLAILLLGGLEGRTALGVILSGPLGVRTDLDEEGEDEEKEREDEEEK